MAISTRGVKQTIDTPMPSVVEDEVRKDDEVVEDNNKLVDKPMKKAEYPKRLSPFLDHHHNFNKEW